MKRLYYLITGRLFAKKVTNLARKLGESDEYWRIPLHHIHETEFLLFTENELNKGRERAKRNKEDI
mgnify:CR=1 FL=1